jgi:hypothetical protein
MKTFYSTLFNGRPLQIEMHLRPRRHTIEFYLETLTGKTIPIALSKYATLGALKRHVQEKEGLPPEQMGFIHWGMQLPDRKWRWRIVGSP